MLPRRFIVWLNFQKVVGQFDPSPRVSSRKNLRRNCDAKPQKFACVAWIFCAVLRQFAPDLRKTFALQNCAKYHLRSQILTAKLFAIAKRMCSRNFFHGHWNYDFKSYILFSRQILVLIQRLQFLQWHFFYSAYIASAIWVVDYTCFSYNVSKKNYTGRRQKNY